MKYVIITDSVVEKLHAQSLCDSLQKEGVSTYLISFPPGEKNKTRSTKEQIEDLMQDVGLSRQTAVIAMGGGVVTDLGAFIASTYCRGVPLILIPTTLLAMVDAAIGGKTGVNTSRGKNSVGTYYLPKKLIISPSYLKTLSQSEMDNGRMEMLKHGLVFDENHFKSVAESTFKIEEIEGLILESIEIKRRVIARDLYEEGVRQILNLGHTIAHALETLSGYNMAHGQAVAAGIVIESHIALKMNKLSEACFQKIGTVFPKPLLKFSPDEIIKSAGFDKKNRDGHIHFVLLEKIGKVFVDQNKYSHPVPLKIVKEVLQNYVDQT